MSSSSSSNTSALSIVPLVVVLILCSCITIIDAIHWDHAVDLNEDFRVLWTIMNQDITFEVQARTLGYVGFGFSRDGSLIGSDVAVGWVDRGQAHFQDRHVKVNGDGEPVVDPSQDYILMLGYENATHTVLRFRRKLDTCDTAHDIPITNDTMKVIYMYHEDEPRQGSVVPGTLPNPLAAVRKYQPLLLTQKLEMKPLRDEQVRVLELRNEGVELPIGDEHMWWCKIFKLEDINRKHYLIRYEPIIESTASLEHLQHIMLYECDGSWPVLEKLSRERGRYCSNHEIIELVCYSFVATWTRGSKGFTFPDDVGYPMNSKQTKYYLMETYFYNPKPEYIKSYIKQKDADSGLKLYITQSARKHDAGVLTIGMQPNWAHIIPPEQKRVVSEGHCIEDCTGYAFPSQGINIFAVLMMTHSLGKEVKLRQIRRNEELPPIAHDKNFDPTYMDYRKLPNPVRSMPGDRLIAECIYDSTSRFTMTLGGTAMYQETCIIQTLYYPRQKDLTSCQSSPSLATVLHSLGIEELAVDSNPVLISSPSELAGMTFESRLSSYDWKNQFEKFQDITRRGPFKPLCLGADNYVVPGTDNVVGYSVNVSKTWHEPSRCKPKRLFATEVIPEIEFPVIDDDDSNNIIEGAARSKVSRSSATETMSLSGARGLFNRKRNIIRSFTYTSIVILLQIILTTFS